MRKRKSTEGLPWWLLNLVEITLVTLIVAMFFAIIWGLAR